MVRPTYRHQLCQCDPLLGWQIIILTKPNSKMFAAEHHRVFYWSVSRSVEVPKKRKLSRSGLCSQVSLMKFLTGSVLFSFSLCIWRVFRLVRCWCSLPSMNIFECRPYHHHHTVDRLTWLNCIQRSSQIPCLYRNKVSYNTARSYDTKIEAYKFVGIDTTSRVSEVTASTCNFGSKLKLNAPGMLSCKFKRE